MTETYTQPFTAVSYQQFLAEGKIMASRCPACETTFLPPRAVCPKCHRVEMVWTELVGKGRLAAFTSIYIAPTFMIDQGFGRDKPYLTAIVALEEGPQISARILGLDASQPNQDWIGSPLVAEFLTIGEGDKIRTDLAFRVA